MPAEQPVFGGGGAQQPDTEDAGWRLPGEAAVVLAPEKDIPTPAPTQAPAGERTYDVIRSHLRAAAG